MQLVKGPNTSDGYLFGTLYGDSSKPFQQQLVPHQRQQKPPSQQQQILIKNDVFGQP